MTPSGMPGIRMREGAGRKGKGTSEPRMTMGCLLLSARKASARKTMGGMPTPPPINRGLWRVGEGTKGLPIGPIRLIFSPTCRWANSPVPRPTRL